MKKWKNLSTRGFALFLALLMCLGTMQVTAFADATDVSGNPPDPTGDVVTNVTSGSETSDSGETTNTETTDTSWSDSQKTEGEFIPGEDGTDVEINETVDSETGVKTEVKVETETATKTDVTTEVSGSQTESKSETYDENGNLIADSSSLSGEQTTTTTTETTTQTTTTTTTTVTNPTETETSKETGPTETTTGQLIVGDNDKKEGDVKYGEFESDGTAAGEESSRTDVDLNKVTDVGIKVDLTAGGGKTESEDKKEVTPDLDAAKEFVKQTLKDAGMDNWLVTDADGQTDGHGAVGAESINLVKNEDGSYSYTFWARIPEDQVDKTGKGDAETTITSVNGNRNTTDNEDAVIEETVTTVENEDGSVTTTVVTTTSTATNTWTTTTTTVEKYEMGVLAKQVTVTVKPGTIKVTGEMGTAEEQEGHGDKDYGKITADSYGPSEAVKQKAENGQNHLTKPSKFTDTDLADVIKTSVRLTYGSESSFATIRSVIDEKTKQKYYVYCTQHGLEINRNDKYGLADVESYVGNHTTTNGMATGGGNGTWNISEDDVAGLRFVLEHGWWGTDSGVGSLDAVKGLIAEEYQNSLDEGIALAVTQAAIWSFTERAGREAFTKDTFLYNGNGGLTDADQIAAAKALFEALTTTRVDPNYIGEKDFENSTSSVTVVEKVDNVQAALEEMQKQNDEIAGKGKTDASLVQGQGDLYQTNLSIQVGIEPSKLNGSDLMIYLYVNGQTTPVAAQRVTEENRGDVTFTNIVLPSGATLTLELKGTQQLGGSAYLFKYDNSFNQKQTFGTYATTGGTSTRDVDVKLTMNFDVVQDQAQETTVSTQTGTEDRTWTETTVTEQGKKSTTTTTETETTEVKVTTEVEVTYSEPETTVEEEQVIWSGADANEYEVPEEPEDPEEPEYPEYPDSPEYPDTPDVPNTPDNTETPETPAVEVPEEPTPLVEVPEDPTPLTEIPDDPTPLDDAIPVEEETPVESEELEELPEDPVPLAEMPAEEEEPEEELLELPEDPVPLADVPATGDISVLWYFTAVLSALGLVILTFKKRENEAE